MASTQKTQTDGEKTPYVISRASDNNYVDGRRSFFGYRDLGVTEATDGRLRCQITEAKKGLSQSTGWHVHHCDAQFVYMLSGWMELEFADGRKVRLEQGDSVLIPGEVPHNEIDAASAFELLEVSIPADIGTSVCSLPD